jgi:xanthine phosphoribosyltransferase
MYEYYFDELDRDIETLVEKCAEFKPDAILAVARGGLMPAQLLAYRLHVRYVQSIQAVSYDNEKQRDKLILHDSTDLSAFSKVLIVDDIVDSGDTLEALLLHVKRRYPQIEFKFASIFYKPTASLQPDFTCKEAKEWINFFWDAQD